MADQVLTEDDFTVFKEAVAYWMEFFGLADWRCAFQLCQLEPGIGAQVEFNRPGRLATFSLAQTWGADAQSVTDKNIRREAFHEVCEVLLDDMETGLLNMWERADKDAKVDWDELNGLRHVVIRRLENSVFETLQE